MYLRSHVQAAKGRHENAREEAIEVGCAARGRSNIGSAARGKGKTKQSAVDWWDLEEPQLLRPRLADRDSKQACVRRGMSEGERAVITPRIGWRKLTDPGD
ncbi:hypothetical protein WN48_04869 [Eufriesea mexicana]|uniref:Uncharacterized protein n=1 Tax=Eufriesea mexicana TaxID=516756 RepID=A0A310SLP2_9HYME|nr:hypothetical protein WN48_04869 [Eufriesea mexicana]